MRAIDADEMIKRLKEWNTNDAMDKALYNFTMHRILEQPTIEPEREKGEWEEIEVIPEAYDITGVKTWASKMRCSQCGFTTFAIEVRFAQYNFCSNCGVDMRGEPE